MLNHRPGGVLLQEQFITAKYSERRFVAPASAFPGGDVQQALWSAVAQGDLRAAMRARVCGADVTSGYVARAAWLLVGSW